jgi:hypothetical protein
MPRKDIYHDTVKRALIKEGWTITHDPFPLSIGEKNLSVDLGAERLISAEKAWQKIVVEIKSFVGRSEVKDLQQAIGQYIMYQRIMSYEKIDHLLYLAVKKDTYRSLFEIELGQIFLTDNFIRLIVFDEEDEEITQWIPD